MRVKVLVTGGRDFRDRALVDEVLGWYEIEVLIHGGARGLDVLAGEYARLRGIREWVFPAQWEKYGRSAGPIRNVAMLQVSKPDVVIAFPGGRGTSNMVSLAEDAGYEVVKITH